MLPFDITRRSQRRHPVSRPRAMAIFSDVMDIIWCSRTTPQDSNGRHILGLDPEMRTFTITMPSVGVFVFGVAICCFCCFKYGLQRWYDRITMKTRTKSKQGITYSRKKQQIEKALNKVTKLRQVEPSRRDLKYEAVALKEAIKMINEHLRNSDRYSDFCERMKRPGIDSATNRRVSFDTRESTFVNPIFNAQQAIDSGYMIDLMKQEENDGKGLRSPGISDEECRNPKHKELELYLLTTGGSIRPSMLWYPGSVAASPTAYFPPSSTLSSPGSQVSPLGSTESDHEVGSANLSTLHQDAAGESTTLTQNVQMQNVARPVMPQTWQLPAPYVVQNFDPSSSIGPKFDPGPAQGSTIGDIFPGSQPRASP
ncbi:uncharacterized protein [Physcomitrium patens]|uniref:uncharacterized protein isoform X2 n=1 Tax=Physcomitrium patens TaxID=3218 RepID=UPI003CCCAA0F